MVPQSSCVGVVYSDASDTGFGGYLVKCGKHEVAGSWDIHQLSFSCTLKELLAVKYVLISLIDKLSGFSVKWFTDNKNVARVKSHIYSMKYFKFSTFVTLDPLA